MRRRVHDTYADRLGTAVEHLGWSGKRDLYRVEWDDPTPHQDTAKVPIGPDEWFHWADEETADRGGKVDG